MARHETRTGKQIAADRIDCDLAAIERGCDSHRDFLEAKRLIARARIEIRRFMHREDQKQTQAGR